MRTQLLQIALPVPKYTVFDYLPSAEAGLDRCVPGVRVLVEFGQRRLIGVIMQRIEHTAIERHRLKRISRVLDEQPLLQPADLEFLTWVASYYHYPVGEVIATALPLRLRKQQQALPLRQPAYRLLGAVSESVQALKRAPSQRAVLEALAAEPQGLTRIALKEQGLDAAAPLQRLLEKQLIEVFEPQLRPANYQPSEAEHRLHTEQVDAIEQISQALDRFAVFLLDGVTGSGKTEVYLQLAQAVLQRAQTVMILVPEISLTPQLRERFAARLGGPVVVLHSGLNESERELAWQQARLGLTRVIVGTRSLVLSPIANLGLIVVDEEHDSSFKQQEGFRYSARDLAVARARRDGCPVVLGSATPCLESLRNVQLGRYQHLQLRHRAGGAMAPRIDLLDIRDQPLHGGIAQPLLIALEQTLAAGQQAMVFLNRRGYAPVLACYSCGWVSECARCDAHQTLHRSANLLWCHHCGSQRRVPSACPACGDTDLHPLGQGTERLEDVLQTRFPDVPLIRVDRDATARKGSLQRLLDQVHSTPSALLVGTQMLAKGHHFPRVTLVGVLDADGGLFSADFRAAERMAQLLIQVAGRAGRGDLPGRVLIQTRYPDHPLLQVLVQQGYSAFAELALLERREASYPPFTHQALLRAEAHQADQSMAFLRSVCDAIASSLPAAVELWGPVPAPMVRRIGRFRAHLLIQSARRDKLHPVLQALTNHLASSKQARKVRWSLDVDPIDTY